MFFHDLKSCKLMLCNVKRADDLTTAESNPVGTRFARPNRIELITVPISTDNHFTHCKPHSQRSVSVSIPANDIRRELL